MKNYAKRIAATVVMTAVCLGATIQLGLPKMAYALGNGSGETMMTVDGVNVQKEEYSGYYGYYKTMMENTYGMGAYLWSMYPEAVQQLLAVADNNCLYARVVIKHFNDLGLKLDRNVTWDYKQYRNEFAAAAAEQGMTFDELLAQQGVDEKMFSSLYVLNAYIDALNEHYYGPNGEKAPKEDEIRAEFEKFFKAKHILIRSSKENGDAYSAEELAEKEALVKEIQDKLAAGEDFDKLMQQYSEDTGLAFYPDGYLFQDDGSFVQEFVDGVKALKNGEISQPVKSDFGWHIIKREALTDEDYEAQRMDLVYQMTGEGIESLIDEWIQQANVEYPDGHEQLTIADILGEEVGKLPEVPGVEEGGSTEPEADSGASSAVE